MYYVKLGEVLTKMCIFSYSAGLVVMTRDSETSDTEWYFLGRIESSASMRSDAYEVTSLLQALFPGFGPTSHSVTKYINDKPLIMMGAIFKSSTPWCISAL